MSAHDSSFKIAVGKIVVCCLLLGVFGSTRPLSAQIYSPTSEGLIKPLRESTLSLAISGRIAEIPAKPGEHVTKGQIILRLDERLETFEAERRALILKDTSELSLAGERVTIANAEYKSSQELYDNAKSLSLEEVNRKKLEAAMAVSELQKLELREKIESLDYEMAKDEVERRHVTAPFDGVVTDIMVEVGEVNQSGRPLAHLVDASQCYLELYLPPSQSAQLALGDEVPILVKKGNAPEQTMGTVDFISPVVDSASGLQKTRILFDNEDGRFTPGSTARLLTPN